VERTDRSLDGKIDWGQQDGSLYSCPSPRTVEQGARIAASVQADFKNANFTSVLLTEVLNNLGAEDVHEIGIGFG
jgi:hypothetical protein